ncbi:2-hydroxychromene-2-carboxylate isomerase [Flexibacterium corallicola]|uniref:2-hydroxychromene-2-carboxylate isomerase n=1 Tax=Flexibacterium corallicola TaxID=3037259 RepID=UPI00286F8DD8|nr:2-hydroxychromene-2-carboxylate isomerase [Pseudovibrio sp. M1P-2-3]
MIKEKRSMPIVSFWYEFASPYSYLSAMTLAPLAQARGVKVVWRPFLLGPIFKKKGWEDSPFNLDPVKGRYMWRDMERCCEALGLPFVKPSNFPQNSLVAARIAYFGQDKAWGETFSKAVFHAQFGLGEDIANLDLLAGILNEIGAPSEQVLRNCESNEVKTGLRAAVVEAEAQGVFGAPTFVTAEGELYWGHDRMDDAIESAFALLV